MKADKSTIIAANVRTHDFPTVHLEHVGEEGSLTADRASFLRLLDVIYLLARWEAVLRGVAHPSGAPEAPPWPPYWNNQYSFVIESINAATSSPETITFVGTPMT